MLKVIHYAGAVIQSRIDALIRVAWTSVVITLLLFSLESFVRLPGRDSSAFLYVAQGILEGEIPYLDRWDHKGPLIPIQLDEAA